MIIAVNTLTKIGKSLLNLLYPLHCASCGKPLAALDETGACEACCAEIKRNPLPYCPRCGRSIESAGTICAECRAMQPQFASARSACLYEGPLKELIHSFKYKNRRSLAKLFSGIMIDFIDDNPEIADGATLITSVPLHRKRFYERGYNQSAILAEMIGRSLGMPVAECLEKTRSTKNQNELTRSERLVNVRNAFIVRRTMKDVVKGAKIVIIDDVMTTGATLHEASSTLRNAGAINVRCCTLARGL